MDTGASSGGTVWYEVQLPDKNGTEFNRKTDVLVGELTFSVPENNRHMINLFFIQNDATTNPAAITNFAVAANNTDPNASVLQKLQYNTGSGWKTVTHNGGDVNIESGKTYTIKVINDFAAKMSYLYLMAEGESDYTYLGEFVFRNPNNTATRLRTGIDNKSNAHYILNSVKLYKENRITVIGDIQKEYNANIYNGVAGSIVLNTCVVLNGEVAYSSDSTNLEIDGNTVTFSAAGTYTIKMTVTGNKTEEIVEEDITLVVSDVTVEDTETLIDGSWLTDTTDKKLHVNINKGNLNSVTPSDGTSGVSVVAGAKPTDGSGFSTNTVYAEFMLEKALEGFVVADYSFIIDPTCTCGTNLLFVNENGVSTTAIGFLTKADGTLQYYGNNNGSLGWIDLSYGGNLVKFVKGNEYTLRLLINFDTKEYKLAIKDATGELFGSNDFVYIPLNYEELRNKTANVNMFRVGFDSKVNGKIIVTGLEVYKSYIPEMILPVAGEAEMELTDGSAVLDLNGTIVMNGGEISIECSGATVENGVVTFDTAGEYEVVVTSSNDFGTKSVTVTVRVTEPEQSVDPENPEGGEESGGDENPDENPEG